MTDREPEAVREVDRDKTGDWPEDFSHENGNYLCACCECSRVFMGHKRRVVCKVCSVKEPEAVEPLSAEELTPEALDLVERGTEARALLDRFATTLAAREAEVERLLPYRAACNEAMEWVGLKEDAALLGPAVKRAVKAADENAALRKEVEKLQQRCLLAESTVQRMDDALASLREMTDD